MAGFLVNGTDLDSLFEPIGATPKIADVGFDITGIDISNYYADAALGTPYGTTNYFKNGTDIGTLFAAAGSVTNTLFLYAWGGNWEGQIATQNEIYSWTQVSSGLTHTAAIRSNGGLYTWGLNTVGQLGNNTTVPSSVPMQIGTSSWIAVSASFYNTYAIRQDNALFAWGGGSLGRLGLATTAGPNTIDRSSPTQIGTSSWTLVDSTGLGAGAIRSDGGLFVWGANTLGLLGLNDTLARSSPTQIGTSSWTQISLGFTHSAAIRSDGALFTWGGNAYGQTAQVTPIYSWTAISVGTRSPASAAGIRNDGALFTWGSGSNGVLGFSDTIDRSSPSQVGTSSWTQVSVGLIHMAAIRSDNALFTWGYNRQGQLGFGDTQNRSSPTQLGTNSWTSVSANFIWTAAIQSTGALFTWGLGSSGRLGNNTDTFNRSSPVQVGASSWTSVSAGRDHAAAIRTDGALFTWGGGSSGRLGLADTASANTIDRSSPVQVGTSSWTSVSAGGRHTAAIRNGNSLFTWGAGNFGQLGVGVGATGTINRSSPVQIGSSSWTSVSAGLYHTMAIRNLGSLFTWGYGLTGRLGLGISQTINRSSPAQVGTTDSYSIISAGTFSAGIRNTNILFTWGYGAAGALGIVTTNNRSSPVQVGDNIFNSSSPIQVGTSSWTSVSAGGYHTAAIRSLGSLFTWGYGTSGRLGLADTASANNFNRSSPVQVGTSSWTSISAGNQHTAAIRSDSALFTWGAGSGGRLGLNDTLSRSSPAQVGSSSWNFVNAGWVMTGAILPNQILFGFGTNTSFQIGIGNNINISSPIQVGANNINIDSPVQIGLSSWTSISAGSSHIAALRSDNLLFTWGFNANGELGLNDTINRSSPTQLGSSSWTTISAGNNQTIAIRSDSGLFTWGQGSYGRLGLGDTISRSNPAQVGTSSWIAISASETVGTPGHAGAIRSDNALFMWGYGRAGRLGLATTALPNTVNRSSPVQVGSSSWTSVSAGANFTTAIRTDGGLFSFGYNNVGQLGLGTGATGTVNRSSPVQIGTSSWTSVSAGGYWAAAISSDKLLFTWGSNSSGRLGLNDTLNRSFPVQVGTSSWSAVNAGNQHGVALRSDAKLFVWGTGSSGRLGLANTAGTNTIDRSSPTQVGTSSWSRISAGGNFTSALKP